MDTQLEFRRGETAAHARLKRLALIWAQANEYSICALEVQLPRSRYRADAAAYRADRDRNRTAIFECKQCVADLRRDNCCSETELERLRTVTRRRDTIERHLRVHYPTLLRGESLFPEYDALDASKLNHRGHRRVVSECGALEKRLVGSTKFETLIRYRCANLLYAVVPTTLYDNVCVPSGWGVLVERGERLELARQPVWLETTAEAQAAFLMRVARAATRAVNRQATIRPEELAAARAAEGI